jgi:hypothetical protein
VELFLNLAGFLVAIGLVCFWVRTSHSGRNRGSSCSVQAIALCLLILILFPVISVTDDLMAAQNPAETDSLQRRNLQISFLHLSVLSAALPLEAFRMPTSVDAWSRIAQRDEAISSPSAPALAPIENRPPPCA